MQQFCLVHLEVLCLVLLLLDLLLLRVEALLLAFAELLIFAPAVLNQSHLSNFLLRLHKVALFLVADLRLVHVLLLALKIGTLLLFQLHYVVALRHVHRELTRLYVLLLFPPLLERTILV